MSKLNKETTAEQVQTVLTASNFNFQKIQSISKEEAQTILGIKDLDNLPQKLDTLKNKMRRNKSPREFQEECYMKIEFE